MPAIQEMLSTHPQQPQISMDALTECIQACFECAQVCTSCADACLSEDMVADLRYCIRTNLDCADVCNTTGRVLVRQTEPDWGIIRAQLQSCHVACKACGDECEKHKNMHEHCAVCVQSCRRCEKACESLLAALPA